MKGLSVSFALAFLLFTCVSWAQVSITFTNKDIGYCIDCGWLDPGVKSGVQPTAKGSGAHGYYGGWWDIADQSKKVCFNRDSSSASFGKVNLCCLGVSSQDMGGNFIPWKITYFYKDTGGVITKDSISITIYPLPMVTIGADESVCQNGNPFQIYPYPNTGVGSSWLSPPSPVPNISGSPLSYDSVSRKHFFNPQKATEDTFYTLVYVTTKQYPKAQCQNADTAMVYIRPIPKVDAGRLSDVCEDAPLMDLQTKSGARVFPGSTNGIPKWTGPGVNSANGTFDPKGAGVSYLQPNVLQFCFTNDTGCTACDTTSILVHKLPATTLAHQPDVCEIIGAIMLVGNQPGQGTGTYTVNSRASGNLFSSFPSPGSPVKYGKNYATYTFTNVFGCAKTAVDSFNIQAMPKVSIIGPNPFYPGQPFSMKADIRYSSAWRWMRLGDGLFTFGTPQQQDTTSTDSIVGYLPGTGEITNGYFIVTLWSTDNGICPAVMDSFKVGIWAMSVDRVEQNNFRVYPNPTNGKFTIETGKDKCIIRVIDLTGKERFASYSVQSDTTIDFSEMGLSKGMYFVQVERTDGLHVKKVVYR